MNYFNILQIPIQFNLSIETIENQLMEISNSTNMHMVNQAYTILKNDYTRGKHIITIKYPKVDFNMIKLNKDFLELMMQMSYHKSTKATEIKNLYNSIYKQTNQYFILNEKQLFCINVVKIKFIEKLLS